MITEKEFINIINQLKKTNDFVDEINNKARELREEINLDFFDANGLTISHEAIVIRLLENIFNDKETLSWWIYEMDYGREFKIGDLSQDGVDIDISTPEKLYKYLKEGMTNE